MTDTVLCAVADGIATLTLNRREKLNAIDYAMADALLAYLDRAEADDAIRAVIITGAGDRAFSAGADIRQFADSVAAGPAVAVRDFVRRGQAMTARIENFPKPVITAVNGLAFGGGCEIVEASHLSVASNRAIFAKPEIRLGMVPTFGGSQRLARLAGRKRALAALLTGDPFPAATALEMGLVNQVVPHNGLMDAARTLAFGIIRHSPLAVAANLAAVTRGVNMPISEGLLVEAEQFARLAATQDLAEGLSAWKQGRSARYQGR